PLAEAFAWYAALHGAIAGLGTFVLGRLIGLRRSAALFAALAYMFGGAFITNATFPQVVGVAAWIPVLLAIVEAMVQRRRASRWLWLAGAVVVALQFLAGHPEVSAYALLMTVAFAVVRLATTGRWAIWGGIHIATFIA